MAKACDKFPLALSGWTYLAAWLAMALVAAALLPWWLAIFWWLAAGQVFWFFRDPARSSLAEVDAILSPADGRVVAIEEVDRPDLPGGRAQMVSVFMNLLDVHVNRAPVAGKILSLEHFAGGFQPASRPGARTGNERQETLIETRDGRVLAVAQVAGLVARRIENWLTPGEKVDRGQRIGMIKFGSRLDVYLPLDARVSVGLGQRVKAGSTVIARMKPVQGNNT